MLLSSSPLRVKDEPVCLPPQSNFEPKLPPSVTRETRLLAPKFIQPTFVPAEHPQVKGEPDDAFDNVDTDYADDGPTEDYGDGEQEPAIAEDEGGEEKEDHNAVISRRIAEGGKQMAVRESPSQKMGAMDILMRLVLALLSLAASGVVLNYKYESAPIGYCDAGRQTNNALETLLARRRVVETCNRENRTLLADGSPCPLPALPVPQANSCTQCPEHGTCTQFDVICDTGYLLRPHQLLFFLPSAKKPEPFWHAVKMVTDGLPGLGSIGLPPRCVEDPRRKRHIGALGKAVEKELGQTRGRRLCAPAGRGPLSDAEGGEARRWGYEMEDLAKKMRLKTSVCFLLLPRGTG